jgi:hypothetical protein
MFQKGKTEREKEKERGTENRDRYRERETCRLYKYLYIFTGRESERNYERVGLGCTGRVNHDGATTSNHLLIIYQEELTRACTSARA